jgi:hypothetical protein
VWSAFLERPGTTGAKGEKGIAILASCLYRKRQEDVRPEQSGRQGPPVELAARELRGFRVVHVFDYSQTEGAPLVDVAPEQLRGPAPEALWDRLAALVHEEGFTLGEASAGARTGTRDSTIVSFEYVATWLEHKQ